MGERDSTRSQEKKKQREIPLPGQEYWSVSRRLVSAMIAVSLPLVLLVAGGGTCRPAKRCANQGSAGSVPVAHVVANDCSCDTAECSTSESSPLGVGSGCTAYKKEGGCGYQEGHQVVFHGLFVFVWIILAHLINSGPRSNENHKWEVAEFDA